MFFGKQNTGIRGIKKMHPIVFLPLFITIIIVISSCSEAKGSIVILENPSGAGFTMDFNKWSSKNKCELSLNKGDELQGEVNCKDGEITLTISGKTAVNLIREITLSQLYSL